ncbi:MAG: dephospho-CoA kinase [Spirochaetia bacterium]
MVIGVTGRYCAGKNLAKNRLRLEGILHPLMKTQINRILENKVQDYVLNAALLFRMDLHLLCDFVIVIKAPFFVRLQRALRRDRLSIPSLLQRFLAQRRIFPKLKTKGVDIYYEYNKGSAEMLAVRITAILRKRRTAEG